MSPSIIDIGNMPKVQIDDTTLPLPVFVQNKIAIQSLPAISIGNGQSLSVSPKQMLVNTTMPTAIVGAAIVTVMNNPSLTRIIFRNAGATGNIYLGGTSLTKANAAIVLEPNEVFIDDMGAAARWCAIADNEGSALNMQVLAAGGSAN
ncbi:MAG: hypothetical protein NVS3B3_21420 [Aquirhabdus sp.]